MRNPLLAPMSALAVGIAIDPLGSFRLRDLALAILGLAVLAGFSLLTKRRKIGFVCATLACVLLGTLVAEWHRPGEPPQLNADDGESLTLVGCVVEPPALAGNRDHVTLELAPGARASVNILLRDGETNPRLEYGQNVEIFAKVKRPKNFQNPGSFDYATFLARQNIYWNASARGASSVKILKGSCGSLFSSFIFRIRVICLERLEGLYKGNDYATGMMEATLLGDSTKLQKVWTDHFRRTGTYHALVISGLHVTVLAGTLLFVLRLCWVPELSAFVLAAVAAWLYVLITGWQAPAVRSAGGFTLFLIARVFYRRGRILNVLAAVAICFLLLDPGQLFDPSFQLSFLAVAAIGALATPLLERTSIPRSKASADLLNEMPEEAGAHISQFRLEMRLIAETIAAVFRIPIARAAAVWSLFLRLALAIYDMALISAVMQIALALPMILYFHRVSFSGLSANVLVVPALSGAIPIGFLAIVLNWSAPAIAARWLLDFSQWVVDRHVVFEPNWRIPDPPLWLALSFAAALILAAILADSKPAVRRSAICAVLIIFALLCVQPFRPAPPQGWLELTALDVGQGDGMLLRFPNGALAMVDCGGIPSFGANAPKSNLDIGEDVISPYLWRLGVRHLDVVVSSHAHDDHIGGMASVIQNFSPREVWTGAVPPNSESWRKIQDAAAAVHARIRPLQAGTPWQYSGAEIQVLAPSSDYQPSEKPSNNDSLVLLVRYGQRAFLLTGDMEKQIEAELVGGQKLGHVDVLKVGHHGSRTSSTQDFIDALHPSVALISVGANNMYHHPTKEVLARLEAGHTETLRTDRFGLLSVRSDGHRLEVQTSHWSKQPQGSGSTGWPTSGAGEF